MSSFQSLSRSSRSRSRQGCRAYDVGVTKGERKIRGESDERGCTEEKAKQKHLSQTYLNIRALKRTHHFNHNRYNLLVNMISLCCTQNLVLARITCFSPELTLARQSSFRILRSPFVTSYVIHSTALLWTRPAWATTGHYVYTFLRINIFLKLTHRFTSEVLY